MGAFQRGLGMSRFLFHGRRRQHENACVAPIFLDISGQKLSISSQLPRKAQNVLISTVACSGRLLPIGRGIIP